MVRLQVLSGKSAGIVVTARRFPFLMGRDGRLGLALQDSGVWDNHCELFLKDGAFFARPLTDAILHINGETTSNAPLRNGDILELGEARIRFSLEPTTQKTLSWRENATWAGLALLVVVELLVIYALI
jgi:predicted component of type VI protein secretion system